MHPSKRHSSSNNNNNSSSSNESKPLLYQSDVPSTNYRTCAPSQCTAADFAVYASSTSEPTHPTQQQYASQPLPFSHLSRHQRSNSAHSSIDENANTSCSTSVRDTNENSCMEPSSGGTTTQIVQSGKSAEFSVYAEQQRDMEKKQLLQQQQQQQQQQPRSIPRSIKFMMFYMFCQAYCFYGLASILSIYFRYFLNFPEDTSLSILHWWIASTFFFSIIGGFVGDTRVGKVKTIVVSSIIWLVGMGVLVGSDWPTFATSKFVYLPMIGLVLAAAGKGAATPVNSALTGDECNSLPEEVLTSIFARFYFFLTFGSLVAKFVSPLIRTHVPTHNFASFTVLTGLLGLGLIAFLLAGFKSQANRNEDTQSNSITMGTVLKVIRSAWKHRRDDPKDEVSSVNRIESSRDNVDAKPSWLDKAACEHSQDSIRAAKSVTSVLLLFTPLPIFWALYYQTYGIWVFQADNMNRRFGSFTFCPDQTQTLLPLFELFLIPFFNRCLYPSLQSCTKHRFTPLKKMTIGMLSSIASFAVAGILQIVVDGNPFHHDDHGLEIGGVFILWQMPQYFLLAIGEIMFSITGLQFAYCQTPPSLKGFITSMWYLCVGLGNILVAILARAQFCSNYCQLFSYSGLMLVAALIFIVISWKYQYKDHWFRCPCDDTYVDVEVDSSSITPAAAVVVVEGSEVVEPARPLSPVAAHVGKYATAPANLPVPVLRRDRYATQESVVSFISDMTT